MSEDDYSRVFGKNAKTEKGQVFGRSFWKSLLERKVK
jgi:hypothetical protein